MKRTMVLVVALLALVGTAGVFASGSKEEAAPSPQPPREGPPGFGQGPSFSEEKLSVSGELYFKNLIFPVLKSGGEEYYLMAPRFYVRELYELGLQDGARVSLEGYKVTGMPAGMPYAGLGANKDDQFLWVAKAVIDGKEYDLQRDGPRMGGGRMGARRGGRMGRDGRGDWGSLPYRHWGS